MASQTELCFFSNFHDIHSGKQTNGCFGVLIRVMWPTLKLVGEQLKDVLFSVVLNKVEKLVIKLLTGLLKAFCQQLFASCHFSIKTRCTEGTANTCPVNRLSYLSLGSLQLIQSCQAHLGYLSDLSPCLTCQFMSLAMFSRCAVVPLFPSS